MTEYINWYIKYWKDKQQVHSLISEKGRSREKYDRGGNDRLQKIDMVYKNN